MNEKLRSLVGRLFEQDRIEGFLGLRKQGQHVGPHWFRKGESLDELVTGIDKDGFALRYPLTGILQRVMEENPENVVGVAVLGCDERAVRALAALNQLDPSRITTLGIACSKRQAELCRCPQPYPDHPAIGTPLINDVYPPPLSSLAETQRKRTFWLGQFQKCIKCFGCRNICPICTCKDCSLEHADVVRPGSIPPEFPMFHLVRAVHMAGRCIDCGLCEEACPAHIPLRTLYKMVNGVLSEHFGYRAGVDPTSLSPLQRLAEPPATR